MAIVLPSTWSSTGAYTVGAKVDYNGVGYECVTAVAANATGNAIPVDNSSWSVYAVFRITDYYSLQEAIELAINSNSDIVNASIPLYIQNIERKVGKLLRSPAQRIERQFTLDADGKFAIPADMLEVYHIRLDQSNAGLDLQSRGALSFQRMDKTSFEELRQWYSTTYWYPGNIDDNQFPGWYSDDQYIYLAPTYAAGTEILMTYYQEVPELGSTVGVVNANYEPINSAGQTLAQWVAAGNAASTFVQDEEVVLRNLWTATTPHVLKAGACREAEGFLNNREMVDMWQAQFEELMVATQNEFLRYDASGSTHVTQSISQPG